MVTDRVVRPKPVKTTRVSVVVDLDLTEDERVVRADIYVASSKRAEGVYSVRQFTMEDFPPAEDAVPPPPFGAGAYKFPGET